MNQATPTGNTLTLETERLILRPLSAHDAPALHRISNEPPVRRYLWDDEPVTSAQIEEVVAQSVRMFSEEGVGLFGVRLRGSSGELVGFCGFGHTRDGPEEIELIYELLPELWGRGLATEASRACLHHAFATAGLDNVVAGADARNVASLRVIEKLGMTAIGEIAPGQPGIPFFALNRNDFLASEASPYDARSVRRTPPTSEGAGRSTG
jgi:RimJ/RimL family protein N-acetyltransferase